MQLDEYICAFFQMEVEQRFFSMLTPNGDPFWDVVRLEVINSLFEEIVEPGVPRHPPGRRPSRRLLGKIRTAPFKIASMTRHWRRFKSISPADFVAYICSRYKDVNGAPVDFAADDALRILSEMGTVKTIESKEDLTRDLNSRVLLSIAERARPLKENYQRYLREVASVIANAQRQSFGVIDPHLPDVIRRIYKSHMAERQIWGEILDRSRPCLVLMTQNGIQKGLILEARKRHVSVVECQHGLIHSMHPAYSYPSNLPAGETVIVPDALLLFSDHWKSQCCMPGTELVVVGNGRFSSANTQSTRTGAAVFVSAGPFHKYLSPLAVNLARSMPDRPFIMKLHPSFLSDRATIEKEYQGIANLAVVGIEKSVPELMVDASDMVIVESTAAYEALDRGIPVHILRKAGYVCHKDLFTRPDVYLFSAAEELQSSLFKPTKRLEDIPRFFDPFDPAALRKFLGTLISA